MVLSDCSTTGIIESRTRYPATELRVGEVDKDKESENPRILAEGEKKCIYKKTKQREQRIRKFRRSGPFGKTPGNSVVRRLFMFDNGIRGVEDKTRVGS